MKNTIIKAGKEYKIGNNVLFTCCDCGLTHRYIFRVYIKNGKPIWLYLKAWRNEKWTKINRKKYGNITS